MPLAELGVAGSLAQYQTATASEAKGIFAAVLTIFGQNPLRTRVSLTLTTAGTRALRGSSALAGSKPRSLTWGDALVLAIIGLSQLQSETT